MNQKQRAEWEQTRAKGWWRFVLLIGLAFFGALMAGSLVFSLFGRDGFLDARVPVTQVLIYLATGLVFGLSMWLIAEYRYRKSSSNIPPS